jgi:hypothetical protein
MINQDQLLPSLIDTPGVDPANFRFWILDFGLEERREIDLFSAF